MLKLPNIALKVGIASELIAQALGVLGTEGGGAHTSLAVQLVGQRLHSLSSALNESERSLPCLGQPADCECSCDGSSLV